MNRPAAPDHPNVVPLKGDPVERTPLEVAKVIKEAQESMDKANRAETLDSTIYFSQQAVAVLLAATLEKLEEMRIAIERLHPRT